MQRRLARVSRLVLGCWLAVALLDACGRPDAGDVEPDGAVAGVAGREGAGEEPRELVAWGSAEALRLGQDEIRTPGLDSMIARGVLRVLVPFGRTYFYLDGGTQQGIAYEAFREFETFLNQELDLGPRRLRVLLMPTSRGELLRALVEGRGDLAAAAIPIRPADTALVDFSVPFAGPIREVIAGGPTAPPLTGLDDLAGTEVLVRASSGAYASMRRLSESFEAAGRPPVTLRTAEEHLEDEDLLEMANAGLVPLVVVRRREAELWSEVLDRITVHSQIVVRAAGQPAWALRKNSPRLKEVVNRFVARHPHGSFGFRGRWKRYWGDVEWVRNALAHSELERYRAVAGLFERYAGEYGFPSQLLLAQAYQESGLDQSAIGPLGAVGIMQVLPTTAADPSIGIPDVSTLEDNVHAGVKYMEFLRRRYFSGPAIESEDRLLLALAAYNAGPSRILPLRQVAAERGLDPNRWFGNMEVIVAEQVGRRTVLYVDNISKYDAAYRMQGGREAARPARQAEVARQSEPASLPEPGAPPELP